MKEMTMDVSAVADRAEFHALLKETLEFPQWYGENLDALYDCLTDLSGDVAVTFTGWGIFTQRLGSYAHSAKKAMDYAQRRNPHFKVCFLE